MQCFLCLFQLMSNSARYAQFMFQLSELGSSLQMPKLRECARGILKLLPCGEYPCRFSAVVSVIFPVLEQ